MSPSERIRQLLQQRPGLRTQEIASELGLERSQVAAELHDLPADEAIQDNTYRWWPGAAHASALAAQPRTLLANLCRYYLDCLGHESGAGFSIGAGAGGVEFVELHELPFVRAIVPQASDRALKKMLRKVRQERGQITLYVGYGVRVRPPRSNDEGAMRLEPVLLYPIEDADEKPSEGLRPRTGIPLFNLEVLKSLLVADSGNVIDEAIHLSDELGLANAEDDLPAWDEIVFRLQRCRPDWDWRESLNPHSLSAAPALSAITTQGIYNRAILFAATRSPFTYGLETELRALAQLSDAETGASSLGLWLREEGIESPPVEDRPILEVLPLNTEQRQAVVQGLTAPLTVVTGPPGTGKSQVVITLLANMAWHGKSVLFASKNNHAVDVVEYRANELGPHPWLLRMGREEHQSRLAQNLTSTLAETAHADDVKGYEWLLRLHEESSAKFAAVQREMNALVQLRNRVDELERASEPARPMFGAERFAGFRSLDAEGIARRLQGLAAAIEGAGSTQGTMSRLLQPKRSKRAAEAGGLLLADAELLGVTAPAGGDAEEGIEAWEEFHRAIEDRLTWARRAQEYGRALDRLREAKPLEELEAEIARIAEESAHNSLELWRRWLRLWPSRWDPSQRKLLSEYLALLQMIASGDRFDEGAGRKVFRRYYMLFPKVARLLPCWAVTSLSARGRLPLEAGLFDLVVIDEASQCDIASALPLLLRARRAVIIGDPLQLKHVSTMAPQQDRMMLAAHGLAEGRAAWAYSVNSLFDLARSLCRYQDIVNLRDHHRSHRDIITFSNRHFYRGGLRVATDHETLKRPAGAVVRWIDVQGKVMRPSRGGALNLREAEAVVAEVRNLIAAYGDAATIGVVTPFRAQANRIRAMVHQDPAIAERLAALQFVVDTVHAFQGDERDVMLFSPVVSAGMGESTLRFLKNHGNLFNVAITRARSELVVVGDRQAAIQSDVSYLAAFAEYAQALRTAETPTVIAASGPEYPVVAHPEFVSEWERVVYRALYQAGMRPVPQYEEAPYTLDFALFEGERKLDIEIDGENYHRNWDGELSRRDQIRSGRLRDQGWDVMRFWIYELRDDLEGAVARVKAWVQRG